MRPEPKLTAHQWLHAHLWSSDGVTADQRIEALEGYEDMMLEMLAALPPELRLKGPAPEQIVAGLLLRRNSSGFGNFCIARSMIESVVAFALPE